MPKSRKIKLIAGSIMLGLMLVLALVGIFWTPYDPEKVSAAQRYLAPSLKHLFGTDNLGRDVFSRVVVGLKTTCLVAFLIVLIGGVVGTAVGMITGYFGGIVDEILMRINDAVASFPSLLLAVVCVAIFGSGSVTTVVALGILFIPSFARVMRSEAIREKGKDYVYNLRINGASSVRIIFVHVLKNSYKSLVSALLIGINNAIIAESSLSFLGLGVQPPTPSLGRMMSEGQGFILKLPWISLFPGFAIVLVVLGLSLVSDTGIFRKELFIGGKIYFIGERNASLRDDKILKIENLTVSLDKEILHGLSIDVKKGETLGLVGESGSGKSTTAKAIMEVLDKERGHNITQVFQEPFTALDPLKRIGYLMKEICFVGKAEEKDSIIRDTLKMVELNDVDRILKSYPNELSGGERQRVIIAMAVINKPQFIICDEPTTALDKDVQDKIIELLLKLKNNMNLSMLFISHDISIVRKISDRVLVLKGGEISEDKAYNRALLKEETTLSYKTGDAEDFSGSEEILEVKNVNLYYTKSGKKSYVRKNVNLSVKRGMCMGIKGGSGCGKSTLLKAICGLVSYEGEINKKTGISMVFQDPYSSLDAAYTIGQQLDEVQHIYYKKHKDAKNVSTKELRKKNSIEMLRHVGLKEEYYDRYPANLSGGERQRAAIGVALIAKPELILLDEPVTALDVTTRDLVMKLLMKLKNEDKLTYLLVSHDEELLAGACDEIIYMTDKE